MSYPVNDLAQSSENSLQLIQVAEFDGDLARTLLAAANGDSGTQSVGDFFLQAQQVTVDGLLCCRLWWLDDLLDQTLGFAHR